MLKKYSLLYTDLIPSSPKLCKIPWALSPVILEGSQGAARAWNGDNKSSLGMGREQIPGPSSLLALQIWAESFSTEQQAKEKKSWRRSDGAEHYLKESSRVNSRKKLAALSFTNEARKCISPYYWSHIAFFDAQLTSNVYSKSDPI